MVEAKNKLLPSSQCWWFESHNNSNPRRAPWLQSTLSELDQKTKGMLKLINEDADSFAQRAEMYYKKRPELINMVEDFYRTHRSLAEKYDQLKSDPTTRLTSPWSSPLSFTKYQIEKSISNVDIKSYDSYSENYETEGSEVEDPENEGEGEVVDREINDGNDDEEAMKVMREEIERLREENRVQKEELMQKDEEKREVIRQLSMAVEVLKEDNTKLRQRVLRDSSKNQGLFDEFNKLKGLFWGKLEIKR